MRAAALICVGLVLIFLGGAAWELGGERLEAHRALMERLKSAASPFGRVEPTSSGVGMYRLFGLALVLMASLLWRLA